MALKTITIEANDKDGNLLGTATVTLSASAEECIGNATATFEDGTTEVLWETDKDHHADAVRQMVVRVQNAVRVKARSTGVSKKKGGILSKLG